MLELALAADRFGQRPSLLYGFDMDATDHALLTDFDLTCNFRLILWDTFLTKKHAEAMKADDQQVQHVPIDAIPEFSIEKRK